MFYPEAHGYIDAVGDLGLVSDKWGPSLNFVQIRSLRDPMAWGLADRWRIAFALYHSVDFAAKAAFVISKEGTDFTPWSTFKNGTYEQYLGIGDFELRTGHQNAGRWNE